MCQEQSFIHPLCHHFTTRRLTRCYPRGRSSQCTGKAIVSQHWASTQLCASCRAAGYPIGEVTTNPLPTPWATGPYFYPWYPYGPTWDPVIGWESESSWETGMPPPYTPSNTGATVGGGTSILSTSTPEAPTITTTPARPPPPALEATNPWARFMSHTPPLPAPPAAPRQHPWEQYLSHTPAPPVGNPWTLYQAPQAQPSARASLTAAPAANGNWNGWGGLMGTSAAPVAGAAGESGGNPRAALTRGNGNAVPSAPAAARGSGSGTLGGGSGSAARAADGEAKDLGDSGWAGFMVRSFRASQE